MSKRWKRPAQQCRRGWWQPSVAVIHRFQSSLTQASAPASQQLPGACSSRRSTAEILLKQQTALTLLTSGGEALQYNVENLLQLGLSQQQLVAALCQTSIVLALNPEHLARLEVVLQQEVGADSQLWPMWCGGHLGWLAAAKALSDSEHRHMWW